MSRALEPSVPGSGSPPTVLEQVLFAALIFGSGLDAYAVGPVPIPWLVSSGACGLALLVGLRTGGFRPAPGDRLFFLFLGWISVVGLINLAWHDDHARAMPAVATTSHEAYIGLRIFEYLVFFAVVQITYWFALHGQRRRVLRYLAGAGTILAIAALYIYVAPLYGLPEPPRTRVGTGGQGAQAVTEFTYAFHRAVGTFREPSHLAEWLVVPLFASIVANGRWLNFQTVIMAWALLLTGSLTGIIGAVVGFLMAAFSRIQRPETLKSVVKFVLLLAAALLLFDLAVRGYGDGVDAGIVAVVMERVSPILFEGGMTQTNRGYIYEHLGANPPSTLGVGLGNANIRLAEGIGNGVMATFLSLYFNVLYASGPIGLCLLGLVLACPIVLTLRDRGEKTDRMVLLLAAYIAWLVMFAVHAESLAFMFAIAYGLLVHEAKGGAPAASVPAAGRAGSRVAASAAPLPLRQLAAVLARRWRLVVGLPAAAVVVFVGVALLRPRTYTADTSFVVEAKETASPSLAEAAARFGLDEASDQSSATPDFYADLLRTRQVLRGTAESRYRWSEGGKVKAGDLRDYYGVDEADPAAAMDEAITALRRDIVVTVDPWSGLVTLAVTSRDPGLSRDIAARVMQEVTEFDTNRRRSRVTAEREFLAGRLGEVEQELRAAEQALERFQEANREFAASSPLSFQLRRLEYRVQREQARYAALAQAYELARVSEVRNAPVITPVDPPGFPVPPNPRPLVGVAVLAAVYGLLLALVVALGGASLARSLQAARQAPRPRPGGSVLAEVPG